MANFKEYKTAFRIGAGIFIILIIIILSIAKSTNPDLKTGWVVLIFFLGLIISGGAFFWNNLLTIFKGVKEESKIPEPIIEEEVMKIADNMVKSPLFENHIKDFISREPHNFGKNDIIELKCRLLYKENYGDILHIFINTNFPKKTPVFGWDLKLVQSKRLANSLSSNKEEEPELEVTETENALTGTKSKTVKETKKKKEKTEQEKAKEET